MEIVLAVLLLFGGFALGSTTADKGVDDKQSVVTASHVEGVADSVPVTHVMRGCLSDKSIKYRDLTVPYHSHVDPPAVEASTCEGECTDD